MKISIMKKIIALHGKGWIIAEISEEVGVDVDEVRATIIGNWAEDKRRQSVAEKVAGRLGKDYFNK